MSDETGCCIFAWRKNRLEEKVINNIFAKFAKAKDRWFEFIAQSFLPDEMKEAFKVIIDNRLNQFE